MRNKNNLMIGIGLVLLVVSIYLFTSETPSVSSFSMTRGLGTHGITLYYEKIREPTFFSTLVAGKTYKWKVIAKNTGTLSWEDAWITTRLGISGSGWKELNGGVDQCTGTTISGTWAVDQCVYGIDNINCREDIKNTWKIQYSTDGNTWNTPTCIDDCGNYGRVCALDLGSIPAGAEKTFYFRLTVPSSAQNGGNYPLVTNLMAYVGGIFGVTYAVDTINIGTIAGTLTISMLGILTLLGGIFAILKGLAVV